MYSHLPFKVLTATEPDFSANPLVDDLANRVKLSSMFPWYTFPKLPFPISRPSSIAVGGISHASASSSTWLPSLLFSLLISLKLYYFYQATSNSSIMFPCIYEMN